MHCCISDVPVQADGAAVRRIDMPSREVKTLAGALSTGFFDGTGTDARFREDLPGIAIDGFGMIALVVGAALRPVLL